VGGPDHEGDYLRQIHERLHPGWVDAFIRVSPYKQLGPASSGRQTEISLVLRWDGTVERAEVSKGSGSLEFDAAALNSVWFAAPFPPPVDVLADDGLAHLKWRFARDYRLCSGGEVVRVEFPLQTALPNLAARGRLTEALRRMNDELARVGWSGGDFLSPFARQWLGRPNLSNELDTRAAAALAVGGDRRQIRLLETAVLVPETAGIAAAALERLGVDVGALLGKALAADPEQTQARRPAVVAALRAVPAAATSCPACVEAIAAAAVDPRQPVAIRISLIEMLGNAEATEAVTQALARAAQDSQVGVRGAAIVAQMPRGRGHAGVIRMAALLHDPAPEIRAAATAGVLRAGGDAGIEQLFLLPRERDARPLVAAANELGRMSSEASLDLLKKLLKKTDKTVRVAVVKALAVRTDAGARALVDPILAAARADIAEEPAIRELALGSATPDQLVGIGSDARLGMVAYRALLRANLREEAARWLLANLEQLSAEDRIGALGAWIAEPPKYAAQK
jgi:TonB family protein